MTYMAEVRRNLYEQTRPGPRCWLQNSGVSLGSALNLNGIFFDHFFSLLIVSDVLILLLSLFYTDDYALIMRNSSFVISTILLKLSFSAEGLFAQLLILSGVAFGVGMYYISQKFQKLKLKS